MTKERMDGVTQLLMRQQPELLERFQRTIQEKRLVHAYLFEGARGTGKEELARWIAQTLFCDELQDGQPCGHCNHCLRIAAGEFPDVAEISPDGNTIKVNQVRELKAELSKSGMEGSRKVYLIYDAEKMTVSASNSLLTFLEEPQNDTYLILMTTAKENILPTIRSRCQIVHFRVVNKQALGETLEAQGIQPENAALLAAITNNQEAALLLNQEESFHESKKRTWAWFQLMTDKNPQAFVFVQTDLMDGLKDKNDGHFFLDLLLFYYRDLLYTKYSNKQAIVNKNHGTEYERIAEKLHPQEITRHMENILNGKKHLEANVQLQGVLEEIALGNSL